MKTQLFIIPLTKFFIFSMFFLFSTFLNAENLPVSARIMTSQGSSFAVPILYQNQWFWITTHHSVRFESPHLFNSPEHFFRVLYRHPILDFAILKHSEKDEFFFSQNYLPLKCPDSPAVSLTSSSGLIDGHSYPFKLNFFNHVDLTPNLYHKFQHPFPFGTSGTPYYSGEILLGILTSTYYRSQTPNFSIAIPSSFLCESLRKLNIPIALIKDNLPFDPNLRILTDIGPFLANDHLLSINDQYSRSYSEFKSVLINQTPPFKINITRNGRLLSFWFGDGEYSHQLQSTFFLYFRGAWHFQRSQSSFFHGISSNAILISVNDKPSTLDVFKKIEQNPTRYFSPFLALTFKNSDNFKKTVYLSKSDYLNL